MNGKSASSIPRSEQTPSWLVNARKAFCAGTPFSSPSDVVEAKLKTFDQWTEILEQHRGSNREGFSFTREKNLTPDSKPVMSNSTVRQKILNVVALHCNVHEFGLTAREIGERLDRSSESVYKYLVDLVDDGLLKRGKPLEGMPRNMVLYRVAGEGEAKR
jgi:response regulator of citrate/malate metabolism